MRTVFAFFKRPDGLALALVADGMGGHNAGDVASDMAIQQMESFFYRQTHIILYPQHQKRMVITNSSTIE